MDRTYFNNKCYKIPENKEDFLKNFEAMCNALDVKFEDEHGYKPMSSFLIEIFGALMKYQRGE